MKLIGLMPVRNEAWCLGLSARVALMWCDELIVGLHDCTDESDRIVMNIQMEENPGCLPVHLPSGEWREMEHRQSLLQKARERGATHIAIIDADEILTGNCLKSAGSPDYSALVRDWVMDTYAGMILQLPGYNLRGSLNQYHANGIWGNRWFSVAFADDPRLGWSGDKFHSRDPQGFRLNNYRPIQQGEGGVMHLWGASERRLIQKHKLYKVTERIRWPEKDVAAIDAMYSLAIKGDPKNFGFGIPSAWTYAQTKPEWWLPYAHLIEHLDLDAEPWQGLEADRLIAQYGREYFKGLDLFEDYS